MSKKNKKRILLLFFTSVLALSTLLFSGCLQACGSLFGYFINKHPHGVIMTEGDFVYCYIKEAGLNLLQFTDEGDYIAILELSEEGKQKEVLIIPETIDNRPVVQIGMSGLGWGYNVFSSRNSRYYLPTTIKYIDNNSHVLAFMIEEPEYNILEKFRVSVLFPTSIRKKYPELGLNYATINYIIDEDTYWIDDCRRYGNTQLIEPPTPKKDGYVFNGWYTESECKNKWDFDNDRLEVSKKIEGTNDFTITNFYAGWVKAY